MNTIRLNTTLITSLSSVLFIPPAELIQSTAIANSTWYNIMQRPGGITIQQLLSIANGLHVPVRRFFSTETADLIGQREDYIIEPYLTCYYDDTALHEFVQNCPSATWKLAAEVTGMSYSRLRNSLLAITRTPVTRFLSVCSIFNINPFTILIDPNPEQEKNRSSSKKSAKLLAEITTLRQDIDTLSKTVANLSQQYEALMKAHDALLHRINVNIGIINGSNIGIAAEPLETK